MTMISAMATPHEMENLNSIDLTPHDYEPSRFDAVVSLTSVPGRLDVLRGVLHHLLRQTERGVAIELHVASPTRSTNETWDVIPPWLGALRAVRVIRHDHDAGPALKYLGALRSRDDRAVIVVDDDVLYPPDLIERLLATDRQLGGTAAVCFRGWRIHPSLSFERSVLSSAEPELQRVGIVTGHGGYCLRREHVDVTRLDDFDRAPDECRMMDDIWVSGHLSRKGTPKVVIRGSTRFKLPIASALGADRERRNDIVLRWFARDWHADDLETAE
jgi:glycosyltransferase involved in cell wall biosynthesis